MTHGTEDKKEVPLVANVDQAKVKAILFKAKFILFLMGLIHHCASAVVQGTAKDLADHFKRPEIISVFSGCFTAFQLATKLINAKYLV